MPDPQTYGLSPDWVPGPDGIPYRRAARVIVADEEDRVLLVRGHDSGEVTRSWWFTVGGGVDAGEDGRAGAVRELAEETGLVVDPEELLGPVLTRSALFDFARVTCRQDEDFFFVRVTATEVSHAGWTELQRTSSRTSRSSSPPSTPWCCPVGSRRRSRSSSRPSSCTCPCAGASPPACRCTAPARG